MDNWKERKLLTSYIKRSKPADLKTLIDCLKFYAETKENKEAMVFVSGDFSREVVTWKELYEKSCATARAFVRVGIKKDEVVGICMATCPQWLYFTFGAMMAGARPVGLVCTYKDGSDLLAVMDRLQTCSLLAMSPGVDNADWNIVKKFVTLEGEAGQVSSSKMPYLRYLIAHEPDGNRSMSGVLHSDDFIKDVSDDIQLPEIEEDDIAFLFQTSGSTGIPKLVAHTHKNLMSVKHFNETGGNKILYNDRPFLWLGGFPLNVVYGATRVTILGFGKLPDDRLKFQVNVALKEKCSLYLGLPASLYELVSRQDELKIEGAFQCVTITGQPLQQSFAKCIGELAPMTLLAYCGTEIIFVVLTMLLNREQFKENLCGQLVDIPGVALKIVNENEEIVPVNTKGEVYIQSPWLFKGYYNDPEKTAAVMTSDGWYKTDDIGWLDEQGTLYVEGRKSNMIVSGGMNVTPEILERVLESHPAVRLAAIVPIPDDMLHQVICACVILNQRNEITEEDLRTYFNEYNNDKPGLFTVLPKYYLILEKFIELPSGKLNRKKLANIAKERVSTM